MGPSPVKPCIESQEQSLGMDLGQHELEVTLQEGKLSLGRVQM